MCYSCRDLIEPGLGVVGAGEVRRTRREASSATNVSLWLDLYQLNGWAHEYLAVLPAHSTVVPPLVARRERTMLIVASFEL